MKRKTIKLLVSLVLLSVITLLLSVDALAYSYVYEATDFNVFQGTQATGKIGYSNPFTNWFYGRTVAKTVGFNKMSVKLYYRYASTSPNPTFVLGASQIFQNINSTSTGVYAEFDAGVQTPYFLRSYTVHEAGVYYGGQWYVSSIHSSEVSTIDLL